MLDQKTLVSNPKAVEDSLKLRGMEYLSPLVSKIVELDTERRTLIQEVEALKRRKNAASLEIAKLKKEKGDDSKILQEMRQVSQKIKQLDEKVSVTSDTIRRELLEIPNALDLSVPSGKTPEDNVEIRKWGDIPKFSFQPKSHDELGEKSGILDFKKAGEVSGARFVFLKGTAARLERTLIQFMMDTHSANGYQELIPPYLVNRASLMGTGQLPKFEDDVFRIEKFDTFLIPTAEVPVTNYHRDEILERKELPKKYVAFSPCFRSEAGSYGKDTKGLKRQHQFHKVELVKFTTPEASAEELELLVKDAENILRLLKLPYRVVVLSSSDVGFSAAKTYDIEVWLPSIKGYVEISSCSNFTDYQARRAGIRYRDEKGKVHFVHTVNGSGLAVGRTLMAIMENYQKEDGMFAVPEALLPYAVITK